jgi:hypothetical protein
MIPSHLLAGDLNLTNQNAKQWQQHDLQGLQEEAVISFISKAAQSEQAFLQQDSEKTSRGSKTTKEKRTRAH